MNVGIEPAVLLVGLDQAVFHIERIERGVGNGGVVVYLVEIDATDAIVQDAQSDIPIPTAGDVTLKVGTEAENVALHLVERRREIRGILLVNPFGMEHALVTVVAIEIAQGIRHIAQIHTKTMVGDKILGIVCQPEQCVVLGGIGRFDIEGMDILRIGGAVAKVIDVAQRAILESQVGIERDAGQRPEGPSGTNILLLFLLRLLGGSIETIKCQHTYGK